MMNYVNCGEFTVRGKMQRAVREQVRYYLIIGGVGACVVVYLWWKSAFERLSLRGFLIAMSNSWGLF